MSEELTFDTADLLGDSEPEEHDEPELNDASREGQFLVGKTLVDVRPLNDFELKLWGWDEIPQGAEAVAFVFDNGTVLIPTSYETTLPGLFDYSTEQPEEVTTDA